MFKTLLMAGALALAFASPASAVVMGYLSSDNINETPCSVANPCPVATLNYKALPQGNQFVTPTASTGLSAPAGSTFCIIMTEGQTIRWRDDGTAPTSTVGFLLPVNTLFTVSETLSAFKFIQTAATASVDIACYK